MEHIGTQSIETHRLLLRRFKITDAYAAHNNWFSDPDIAMFMRWSAHTEMAQTIETLTRYIAEYEKPNFYRWAITLKHDGIAIGAIGFHIEDDYDCVADVAYSLSKMHWNQGIVTEALRAVLRYALLDVGINRVEAFHAINNPASGMVMRKAGMVFEGSARQKYKSHKGFEDSDMYAILREDLDA